MYQQATRAEFERSYWSPGPPPGISAAIEAIESYINADRSRFLRDLEQVWEQLQRDPYLRVIHLIRHEYLASYVSFVLAMRDGAWIDAPYEPRQITLDPGACRRWFESCAVWSRHYSAFFGSHAMLEVSYEELTTRYDSVIGEVLEFLSVDRLPLPPATARQRSRPLSEMIQNYGELRRFFAGTEWCDQFQ